MIVFSTKSNPKQSQIITIFILFFIKYIFSFSACRLHKNPTYIYHTQTYTDFTIILIFLIIVFFAVRPKFKSMSNNYDLRHIQTRHSARIFGLNITNQPQLQLIDRKRSKPKKIKSLLNNEWLAHYPQVHPYTEEIASHTRALQHESYILDNYMIWHDDITISMREILIGWLIEIQPKLHLNHHSLYLAILITDKYCHNHFISKNKYQLLGIASLFVAAKYEEVKTPKLKHYFEICGGEYSFEQILAMESDILITLKFSIKSITSCWLLQEYTQIANVCQQNKQLCQYVLDLSMIEFNFCLFKPSLLTWAIIIHVIKTRNLNEISDQIFDKFNLSKYQLGKTVCQVVGLYKSRRNNKFKAVNQKYLLQIGHIIS